MSEHTDKLDGDRSDTGQAGTGRDALEQLIACGKRRGTITYDEVAEALPHEQMTSEEIEAVLYAIHEIGIDILESDDADDLSAAHNPASEGTERTAMRARVPEHPQTGTVFDSLEEDPPPYNCWWTRREADGEQRTSSKLTMSLRELRRLAVCDRLEYTIESHFPDVDDERQLSARDAQGAGCGFDELFWAAGILAAYSPAAATRLSEFAADCLQLLANRVDGAPPERETLLDAVRAMRDFGSGGCSVLTFLRETEKAQQAWMRILMPDDAAVDFPWTRFFMAGQRPRNASFLPPFWEGWARGVAWAAAACLSLRKEGWSSSEAWELRNEHEAWLLSLLVHRFAPEEAPAPPTHLDGDPLLRPGQASERVVRTLRVDGGAFAVLPNDCRRIDILDATGETDWQLPYSLRSIGSLSLERCGDTVTLPGSLLEIDSIYLEFSALHLPPSVRRVGLLKIYLSDSSLHHGGVERFGRVVLESADFAFSEGVREVGHLDASGSSSVRLPASLQTIGDINFRSDSGFEESIDWPEGTRQAGEIRMSGPTRVRVPASVLQVRAIHLAEGASLELASSTDIIAECHVGEGARLIRY